MPQASKLNCATLTSFIEVQKLAPEWQALYIRAGEPLFRDFNAFENWWRTLGQEEQVQLHVAVAKSATGELKAILPLTSRKQGMFTTIEQAGLEVFDNGDVLAESREDAEALLHYLLTKDRHDIALLRDIREDNLSAAALSSCMYVHKQHMNHFLSLTFPSGAEWFASQSRKLRSDVHRKSKKMEGLGELTYGIWRKGDPDPENIVDAIYTQKKTWALSRGLSDSCFLRPKMKDFLLGLVWNAAQKGELYLAWVACGNAMAACHLGFIRNDVLSLYITTYDEAFAQFSPGILLMVGTIKEAVDAGLRELDYMRGEEEYKQRFASGHRILLDYVGGHSLMGKIAIQIRKVIGNP